MLNPPPDGTPTQLPVNAGPGSGAHGVPSCLRKTLSWAPSTTLNRTRPAFAGLGLNKDYLVRPRGFEPLTSASAGLRSIH